MDKWTLVGTVNSSTYRKKIMKALAESNHTPKSLSEITGVKFSHISTILKELSDLGLIKCLTPTLKKNRIYTITAKGKEIVKSL